MYWLRRSRKAAEIINFQKILRNDIKINSSTRSLSTLSVDNGIATWELNRPPVNSMNFDLVKEAVKVLTQGEESKWKGLIISSASPKIFSAGIDLAELYKPDPERLGAMWHGMQEIAIKMITCNFVTAVAINGHSSAGGTLLSMLGDYRVIVDGKFTMGFNDTAVGVVPPVWVTKLMMHTMPSRKAELAIIGSTLFSPKETVEVGMADELASDKADAVERCKAFIKSLDHIAPRVISSTRQLTKDAPLSWLLANRQMDRENFVTKTTSPESQKIIGNHINMLKSKQKAK